MFHKIMTWPHCGRYLKNHPASWLPQLAQRGVTLIELMVGIIVGLLVVAVAMGALITSRGISGTVTDASDIQQQAAYAMRLIGAQLRRSGSMQLNLNPSLAAAANVYMSPVALQRKAPAVGAGNGFDIFQASELLSGTDSQVTAGFQYYTDSVFTTGAATDMLLVRNCKGGPADALDQRIFSTFDLNSSASLRCDGNGGGGAQPMINNVANFQIRYMLQNLNIPASPGNPQFRYVQAASVTNWAQVQGVEVCLELYGNEIISMPNDGTSTYYDCTGTAVDMTTLAGARKNRMHMTFRNVFQLRARGVM